MNITDPNSASYRIPSSDSTSVNAAPFFLLLIPVLVHFFLTGHNGTVGALNYAGVAGLITLLFFLPDHLSHRFGGGYLVTPLLCTVYVLTPLVLAGLLLPAHVAPYVLFVGAAAGAVFCFRSRPRGEQMTIHWSFLLGALFCYLLLYGQGVHSLLYMESVVQGATHIDILMHSSIAESVVSLGIPSTSLDGSPYAHYHWGSHVILGSFARLTGVNSLAFYNLFYPVIFIPLFLKFLFHLASTLAVRLGLKPPPLFGVLLFMAGIFSLPYLIYRVAQPFSGESLLVSLVLVFAHYDAIIRYASRQKETGDQPAFAAFYAASLLLLVMIAFSKISTAFVWIGVCGVLSLWRLPFKKFLATLPGFGLIAVLVLKFVFPQGRAATELILFTRLRNLLDVLGGGTFLLLPLIFVTLFVVFNGLKLKELKQWWRSPGFNEVLVGGTLAGWGLSMLGATFASNRQSDVMLFMLASVIISYPLLLIIAGSVARKYLPSRKLLAYLAICLLVFTHLRLLFPFRKTQLLYSNKNPESTEQQLRQQLVDEAIDLRSMAGTATAVHIPHSNEWFYATTDTVRIKAPLSIPALSGLPLIAGIPQRQYTDGPMNIYTLAQYVAGSDLPALKTTEEIIVRARERGYDRVVILNAEGQRIGREVYSTRPE